MMHTSRNAQLRRSVPDEGMLVEVLNFHAGASENISTPYLRTIGRINRAIHCGASRLRNICWEGTCAESSACRQVAWLGYQSLSHGQNGRNGACGDGRGTAGPERHRSVRTLYKVFPSVQRVVVGEGRLPNGVVGVGEFTCKFVPRVAVNSEVRQPGRGCDELFAILHRLS
jgi:hypothetical protein